MKFFQKFLSIGSRKSKKQRKQEDDSFFDVPPVPTVPRYDEQEATISRFLRTQSAQFAAAEESDRSILAPLRSHFSNEILPNPTGSTSTTSLSSYTQRGTYTVKLHPRKQLSSTEFPNAIPIIRQDSLTPTRPNSGSLRRRSKSVPITPRDKTRALGLRSDPSVASLLDMYDDHGCLDSKIFSNSPELGGRAQTKRSGSTLRQLLGNPASQSSRHTRGPSMAEAAEGDISWAERVLCESTNTSTSSLGVQTPKNNHFTDVPFHHDPQDITIISTYDSTINSNYSNAISSLEVEVSMTADDLPVLDDHDPKSNYPHEIIEPLSPQQTASEAFSFLTTRKSQRRSTKTSTISDRPLPALPLTTAQPLRSRFSASTLATTASPLKSRFSASTLAATVQPLKSHFSASTLATTAQPLASRFSAYSSTDSHEPEEFDLPISTTPDETLRTTSEDHTDPQETRSTIRSVYQKYSGEWPTDSDCFHQETPSATKHESVETNASADTLREGPKLHQVVVTRASDVPSRASAPRGPRPISHYPVHVATPKRPEPPKGIVIPRIIEPTELDPEPRNAFEESSRPLPNLAAASAPDLSICVTDADTDTSHFTPAPSRKSHLRRTSSQRTIASPYAYTSYKGPNTTLASSSAVKPPKQRKASRASPHDKENSGHQPAQVIYKSQLLPMTPSRSVFRSAQTPSPASSTDLSPVAKLMMADLRTKRMEARERQKKSGRWGLSRLR